MSDFNKKIIQITVQLGEGTFGEDVGDTVTLTGYRTVVQTTNSGGDTMGTAQIKVFGLRPELMNKLTTIGTINRAIRIQNKVSVAAGDEVNGLQVAFSGIIFDAWGDYNAAPDVAFNIVAYAGMEAAIKPVGASSYAGTVDVAMIMSELAQAAGLIFENNDVSVKLADPYFTGSTLDKIRECASAARILYSIDRGVLAIWPGSGGRQGDAIPMSKDDGMVGYPTLSSKGMTIKSLFNWNIKLGSDIQVASSIPMANGKWRVYNVTHELSCELENGPWFTTTDVYHNV